jgi:hypothetical protein
MEYINIICTHKYNNFLKKLPEYKMDLGRNYTKKDEINNTLNPNIKDQFVLEFFKESKVLIYKVGVIGLISVYTISELNLPINEIIIYKNGNFIKKEIDLNMAEFDIERNIAEVLWDL